jgi:hypothetical protein
VVVVMVEGQCEEQEAVDEVIEVTLVMTALLSVWPPQIVRSPTYTRE